LVLGSWSCAPTSSLTDAVGDAVGDDDTAEIDDEGLGVSDAMSLTTGSLASVAVGVELALSDVDDDADDDGVASPEGDGDGCSERVGSTSEYNLKSGRLLGSL
jgi:hypothetical protein